MFTHNLRSLSRVFVTHVRRKRDSLNAFCFPWAALCSATHGKTRAPMSSTVISPLLSLSLISLSPADAILTTSGNGRRTEQTPSVCPPPRPTTEKPRFAPPQSTLAIRVGKAGGRKSQQQQQHSGRLTCVPEPDHHVKGDTGRRVDWDEEYGKGTARVADPAGRRRLFMARVGQDVGLDLSLAIDALLLEERGTRQVSSHGFSPVGVGKNESGAGEGGQGHIFQVRIWCIRYRTI